MGARQDKEKRRRTEEGIRAKISKPPQGWERFKWYGPGLLWLVATVGSGQVLFTPRIGSRYGYDLLWAALIILVLIWVVMRESGRYTIVTDRTILEGYRSLPGPRGWAVWLFFLPAILAGVVTIAGIAALVGSILMIALPGDQALYSTLIIVVSIILVVTGRYRGVERATTYMAVILVGSAIIAASLVFPAPGELAAGLAPGLPDDFELFFVLPWFGFLVAGAIGIIWFSYWVSARGYGKESEFDMEGTEKEGDEEQETGKRIAWIRGWKGIMGTSAAIGVFGGGLVTLSFLVLGAEVLGPEGIIPEGVGVAEDLTRLLEDIWGAAGFWIVVVGMFVALWGTVLANQDGGGRTFADATLLLLPARLRRMLSCRENSGQRKAGLLLDREKLKNIYAVALTAAVPLLVFFLLREPVEILSIGGIIAASHTPIVIILTLYLNRTRLPRELRPGSISSAIMIIASIFYIVFATLFFLNLAGVTVLQ